MSLLAAEDAVGQADCGLPLLPAEAATAPAPRPPAHGAGPGELSLPGARPRKPAAGQRGRGGAAIRLEGDTRGERLGTGEERQSAGKAGAIRPDESGCPVDQ